MKIHRLETHDRLKHLKQDQSVNIFKGAEDCLKTNSLSLMYQDKSPYIYIFAHPRTMDDGNKGLYWQPRLSKPAPQTNSYLFRAKSKGDEMEMCWMIPPSEHWDLYRRGNLLEYKDIIWSIDQFRYHRQDLERPDPDDMPEEKGKEIIKTVIEEHKTRNKLKQEPLEGFSL